MPTYTPPITLTPEMLNLVAEIGERLGRYAERTHKAQALRLRRINRIRTIQGSLAIEGNSLSVEQITAVLDGKPVIAPPREVQEVKNALAVYEKFDELNPLLEQDLLKAHQLLLLGLHDEAGSYRSGGVGVMSGQQVVHMAPPANQVSRLMGDLFAWLKNTDQHALIASTVFHYEFEFIHPFADGNGRMGRLWESLILAQWNPVFAHLPVESLVYQHQEHYYLAIRQSTAATDCAPFVEFILERILQALEQSPATEQVSDSVTAEVTAEVTPELMRFLDVFSDEMSRTELMKKLELTHAEHFRLNYLTKALEQGLIEMTIPDKPKSRLQKYRLTGKGKSLLQDLL
ncbi:MAG: Fic family protein [Trichlorobacter sp.]|nr:Fic family protein [Trichlorobacter sp.]